jgi:hypothetical protein
MEEPVSFGAAFALLSLATLAALFIVLTICALGQCRHELHWQIDANKIVKRCYCGERSEP